MVGTAILLCNPSQLVDFGKAIWKDTVGVIEGIGQNMNDEYNRSSTCYTVGVFVPDMALLVATKGEGTGAKTVFPRLYNLSGIFKIIAWYSNKIDLSTLKVRSYKND